MVLDDPAAAARLDQGGMLTMVGRLGPMLLDGWAAAAGIPAPALQPAVVVAAGVGGSGIGGDVLRAVLAPLAPMPVVAVKDVRLPAFVGPKALVCVCSYSGNTAETLAMFDAARAAGAAVVAITSGGLLAERAQAAGVPLVTVPRGLPPRAALPYSLAPMLRVFGAAGLPGPGEGELREAAATLDDLTGSRGPASPTPANPAKQLAWRLADAVPTIYATSDLMAPAAMRWKTQCNENAKRPAVWGAFPDLAHNEVVGWAGEAAARSRFVILLRDQDEGPLAAAQVAAAREVAFGAAAGVEQVWPAGTGGRLVRLLSVIQLGDYVSVYLALLAGLDPTPVDVITALKIRMQEATPPRGTL
jgi:glucose/mannose-6-phosphate isomerase